MEDLDVPDAGGETALKDLTVNQRDLEFDQQFDDQDPMPEELNDLMDFERIADKLIDDLFDKNQALDLVHDEKESLDEKIEIRVQQLAVCKILVNIHQKDLSILVRAYTQLGESYLNNKYFEQALDHLTNALKLNGSLIMQNDESKQYHSHILSLLGRCYFQAGNCKDALTLLQKALKMNKEILGQNKRNEADIYVLVSKIYAKQKMFQEAIVQLKIVLKIFNELDDYETADEKAKDSSVIYIEMAKVSYKAKDIKSAISYQQMAIDLMRTSQELQDSKQLADILLNLSEMQDLDERPMDALNSLKEVEMIYKKLYDLYSPQTCKVKRSISLLYLKVDMNEDAMAELQTVKDLEERVFGGDSGELGKTLKVIGTILILKKDYEQARQYLNKALKIFENRGMVKLFKEVQQKEKLIPVNESCSVSISKSGSAQQMIDLQYGANQSQQENDLQSDAPTVEYVSRKKNRN